MPDGLFDGAFDRRGLFDGLTSRDAQNALALARFFAPSLTEYLTRPAPPIADLPSMPGKVPSTDDPRLSGAIYDVVNLATGLLPTGAGAKVATAAAPMAARVVRKTALPMDEASRMARADALGFWRDMPVQFGTAPLGEKINEAAIKIGDNVYTAPTHLDALAKAQFDPAVAAVHKPGAGRMDEAAELIDPATGHGFMTSAGRYVSRREAAYIAENMGQGTTEGPFGATRGLAAEDLKRGRPARATDVRTATTAPGLPGGHGVWGYRLPPEASGAENVLWHRAQKPGGLDARGLQDWEIQATLESAWERGHDAVMLRNYTTPDGKTGDVLVVKDPAQLRSPSAKFDPRKRDSRNLLAGMGGAAAANQLVPAGGDPFAEAR